MLDVELWIMRHVPYDKGSNNRIRWSHDFGVAWRIGHSETSVKGDEG